MARVLLPAVGSRVFLRAPHLGTGGNHHFPIPYDPTLVGTRFFAQGVVLDTAPVPLTTGLALTIEY